MDQLPMLKLVIAYTLVGVFIFTAVITCISMVGWVKFSDDSQQKKLFATLIVELVVGCVAWFLQILVLDPKAVADEIGQRAFIRAREEVAKDLGEKYAEFTRQSEKLSAEADRKIKDLTIALNGADDRIKSLQSQVSSVDTKRALLVEQMNKASIAERKKLQSQIEMLDREKKSLLAKVDANACLALPIPDAVIGPMVERK